MTSNNWKLNGFTGSPGSGATYRDNVLSSTGETYATYEDPNYFYTDGEWTFFYSKRGEKKKPINGLCAKVNYKNGLLEVTTA